MSIANTSSGSRVAIAATFTAEPVERTLQFWLEELGVPGAITFAPYNQVLQQLYAPAGPFADSADLRVLFVRLEDWMPAATGWPASDLPLPVGLVQNIDEFVEAVRASIRRPLLIVFCPSGDDPRLGSALALAEASVAEQLGPVAHVTVVTSEEWTRRYSIVDPHYRFAYRAAQVPYTDAAYAALATVVARRLSALHRQPHKVVVVDADNTLWSGVCGEIGPTGVVVDGPFTYLQDFLIRQQRDGMIVCLCSKNTETDVWAVFDTHPGMRLRREHLVSWRINWEPKSENLRALAAELDLGLDSFVFIDDNPVECAEVSARCPEVLVVPVPADADRLPALLEHLWIFDRHAVTDEDRRRVDHYRSNARRAQLQEVAPTLAGFLERLDLHVVIERPDERHFTRIAQLSQRTNQFNTSGIRRSEEQVAPLLRSGQRDALVVDVRDRFGDYGLVGAVLFDADAEALRVETLLLSCRALGRSVEQRIAKRLGEIALERGLSGVDIAFLETPRNLPARQFLDSLTPEYHIEHGEYVIYRYAASRLAALDPIASATASSATAHETPTEASPAAGRSGRPPARPWLRFATEWADMEVLVSRLARPRLPRPELQTPFVPPHSDGERQIAAIWEEVFGLGGIGAMDGFAELGGTSLQLVQIHARIQERLGRRMPLTQLFALPTIRAQAGYFSPYSAPSAHVHSIQERALRQKAALQRSRTSPFKP
jgi:FkbH-like protein